MKNAYILNKLSFIVVTWCLGLLSTNANSFANFFTAFHHPTNIVIPDYGGGRFGDQLLAFSHALYFAVKQQKELYLVPFKYSDQLMVDRLVKKYTPEVKATYNNIINFKGGDIYPDSILKSSIVIPFFPAARTIEYTWSKYPTFFVDWNNITFKQLLRELITPQYPLQLTKPLKHKISIALHVRKGGGFDQFTPNDFYNQEMPVYKLPPDEYYVNQIKLVSAMLDNPELYIFLFTDDQNPQDIAERYQEMINLPSITIDYRKEQNHHTANVLEDFFSIMEFDVLIRSESSFSFMAQQLGDHKMIITPGNFLPDTRIPSGILEIPDWNYLMTKARNNV